MKLSIFGMWALKLVASSLEKTINYMSFQNIMMPSASFFIFPTIYLIQLFLINNLIEHIFEMLLELHEIECHQWSKNGKYSVRNEIMYSTKVWKPNLFNFNDAYILEN